MTSLNLSKNEFGIKVEARLAKHGNFRARVYTLPVNLEMDHKSYTSHFDRTSHHFSEAPERTRTLIRQLAMVNLPLVKAVWLHQSAPNELHIHVGSRSQWDRVHGPVMKVLEEYIARWAL